MPLGHSRSPGQGLAQQRVAAGDDGLVDGVLDLGELLMHVVLEVDAQLADDAAVVHDDPSSEYSRVNVPGA